MYAYDELPKDFKEQWFRNLQFELANFFCLTKQLYKDNDNRILIYKYQLPFFNNKNQILSLSYNTVKKEYEVNGINFTCKQSFSAYLDALQFMSNWTEH